MVSRAGALAIAELCIVAKPVLFVPYPHAAEDHQTSNARALVEKGAARMIPDAQARQELLPELLNLLQDVPAQQIMRQALAAMAIRNADERIAGQILAFVSPSKTQQP